MRPILPKLRHHKEPDALGGVWVKHRRALGRFVRSLRHSRRSSFVPLDLALPDVSKSFLEAPVIVPTPQVTDLVYKEDAKYLHGPSYIVPRDYVARLTNVLYCPLNNVILNEARDVIVESSNAGRTSFMDERLFRLPPGGTLSSPTTVLRSRFDNYFHFLVDFVPRMIAVHAAADRVPRQVLVLCPGGLTPREVFFLDKLDLTSFEFVDTGVSSLLRLDDLLFTPFKTRWQSGFLPRKYVDYMRARFCPDRPGRNSRRILVSRQGARRRVEENWDELESSLSRYGFESVRLEDLSLADQIETLYDAEALVGVHGAGLTNMVFATPGLRVLEIFPSYFVAPHYYYLSESLGHSYAVVNGQSDTLNVGRFNIDVAAVSRRVEELLGRDKSRVAVL